LNRFTVNTPFNIELEFSLATFVRRMLASLIDLLLMLSYSYVVLFLVLPGIGELRAAGLAVIGQEVYILELFAVLVPLTMYHFLFEWLMNGQSPGKWLTGIRVVSRDGSTASISQLLLRWILFLPNYFILSITNAGSPLFFLVVVFILSIVAVPDMIAIAVSDRSQRLGDIAAGTVVVNSRYNANINDTIYKDLVDVDYKPMFPQVLRLSDRDINGIRNLLAGKMNREREIYLSRVAYRVENLLEVKMNMLPQRFLEQLLMDYNFFTAGQHRGVGSTVGEEKN
jgi:uncharacterized RDD family membrane protein YckC